MSSVTVTVHLWLLGPRALPLIRILREPDTEKSLASIVGDYAGRALAAVPEGENWSLSIGRFDEKRGFVAIDTLRGDPKEVRAAMEMLRSLV